jgi:hypothetical protein
MKREVKRLAKVRTTITLEQYHMDWLLAQSVAQDRSASWLIRNLIDGAICGEHEAPSEAIEPDGSYVWKHKPGEDQITFDATEPDDADGVVQKVLAALRQLDKNPDCVWEDGEAYVRGRKLVDTQAEYDAGEKSWQNHPARLRAEYVPLPAEVKEALLEGTWDLQTKEGE